MSKNPVDMLKENNTWEDIAQAYMSKGKSSARKQLVGAAILGFLGAKENRMIADTNRKLRALASEQVVEQANALRLWEEHTKVADNHKKYLNDNNYFYSLAEKEFDDKNPNYFDSQFGLDGRSQAAIALREKEIKEKSDFLKNNHFLKMNYKPNVEGRFDFDEVTKLPVSTDETTQIRNVQQTEQQFIAPFENYIIAKQEALLAPENIGWAHGMLNKRFGLETKVEDPLDPTQKVTLRELETRAFDRLDTVKKAEINLKSTPIVTNEELIKNSTIPRFRNIYAQDFSSKEYIFKVGKEEAQERAIVSLQGYSEGIRKNVLEDIRGSDKEEFSIRDLQGIIFSRVSKNSEMENQIKEANTVYDSNFLTENANLGITNLQEWSETKKDDGPTEEKRLSYLQGRTQIIHKYLGVSDKMKDNMVLIERAKVILDPANASKYSNAQKQMAKKELSDLGTSSLEATIIASIQRDMLDEIEQQKRSSLYDRVDRDDNNNVIGVGLKTTDINGNITYITNETEYAANRYSLAKQLIDNLLSTD